MTNTRILGVDQKIRLALWPILTVIFINTFGMLWYAISGLALVLGSYASVALNPDALFRIALLVLSLVAAYFVYIKQRKNLFTETDAAGAYILKGKGVIGFIMHVLIGLVETVFAFFTLNTFWFMTNYAEGDISFYRQQLYWAGFGAIFVISAYLLTRQAALAVLTARRRK